MARHQPMPALTELYYDLQQKNWLQPSVVQCAMNDGSMRAGNIAAEFCILGFEVPPNLLELWGMKDEPELATSEMVSMAHEWVPGWDESKAIMPKYLLGCQKMHRRSLHGKQQRKLRGSVVMRLRTKKLSPREHCYPLLAGGGDLSPQDEAILRETGISMRGKMLLNVLTDFDVDVEKLDKCFRVPVRALLNGTYKLDDVLPCDAFHLCPPETIGDLEIEVAYKKFREDVHNKEKAIREKFQRRNGFERPLDWKRRSKKSRSKDPCPEELDSEES